MKQSIEVDFGDALVGPPGSDGAPGKDGANGKDSTVAGPKGDRGTDGSNGTDGRNGADGADGAPGKDTVLPEGLVTIDELVGVLFGTPVVGGAYRLISGVAQVSFSHGHGAFALPNGTKGVASFHATLVGSPASVGVVAPTDASSLGLLADADGTVGVTYLALIW